MPRKFIVTSYFLTFIKIKLYTGMNNRRNDFFDFSEEEEDAGNENLDFEDSRFSRVGRSSAKRRKLDTVASDGESADSDTTSQRSEAEEIDASIFPKSESKDGSISPVTKPPSRVSTAATTTSSAKKPSTPKIKPLTPAQLAASRKKAQKSGVIYLSRIPPFLKVTALRKLLTPYGKIGRIFLTPETSVARTKRIRAGGSKKKSFTEGWLEFASKRKARICAETLNGNTIGGKKGSFYYDDVSRSSKLADLQGTVRGGP